MGADLKGRLNQSVPETREVNMWGLNLISNRVAQGLLCVFHADTSEV